MAASSKKSKKGVKSAIHTRSKTVTKRSETRHNKHMSTVYKDATSGRFMDNSSPSVPGSTMASSNSIEHLVKIVRDSKAILEQHKNDSGSDD